jgi:hypothetical protein
MAETSLAQLAVYMSRYEIDSNLIGRSWDYLRAGASKHEQGEFESADTQTHHVCMPGSRLNSCVKT